MAKKRKAEKGDAVARNEDGTFTKEGARVAGSIGGQNCTDLKRFTLSLVKRKYCTMGCPVYERCPGMIIAQGRDRDKNGKVPCILKEHSPALRVQMARLFFGGKTGLVDQIMTSVYRHTAAVEDAQTRRTRDGLGETPDLYEKDARLQIDLYKVLYGEKKSVDLTGSVDVPLGLPDDPELLREVGDLLASKMNKKEVGKDEMRHD